MEELLEPSHHLNKPQVPPVLNKVIMILFVKNYMRLTCLNLIIGLLVVLFQLIRRLKSAKLHFIEQ